jgi:hypothetical protein
MTQSGHRGRKVLAFNIAGVVLAGTLATAEFITLRGRQCIGQFSQLSVCSF